jgi:uncharacterized membrane protein
MIPLVVMIGGWAISRALGAFGRLPSADSTVGALRYALAAMFAFTALSHFLPVTRPDLIRMVPPVFPASGAIITVTGLLELAGAIGLLLPGWTRAAAYCLAALLVAMFPANVYAAREGLEIGGAAATPLVWRLPLQLFWIAALIAVGRRHPRPTVHRPRSRAAR